MTDATLAADVPPEGDFRLGTVIGRSSGMLRRNFLMFFLISSLANVPMSYLLMGGELSRTGGYFLGLVCTTFGQTIVLHSAFQEMQGTRIDLRDSVRAGLRRFLPVVGTAIIVTLLGCLGVLFFVLPGLVLFTTFFVATPACVLDELGVFASMGRSAQLTDGNDGEFSPCCFCSLFRMQ